MRILLTGTYNSANKGDAAMQYVFATELQRRKPDAVINIASPFPENDRRFYAPVTVVRSHRRNLPLATLHWIILEVIRLAGYRPRRYYFNAEIDAMAQADIVVDLSGDMLTDDYGPLIGYSHFLPLLQALALDCPVIVCAQSIGPFDKLLPLARYVLSRSQLITVRDSISIEYLKSLQETAITPEKTADLAFLLPAASPGRITELLTKEGIQKKSRHRLGVSVSALVTNNTNRYLEKGSTNDSLAVFAQALDSVVDSLDVEVILVPHVFGPRPGNDDRKVGKKLAALMKHDPLCLEGEYRPEELKGIIADCDTFVGCRMHANISALDSLVPVLAVGYSHKTEGILADLGLAEWCLSIHDLELNNFRNAIIRLIQEASTYRQLLADRIPAARRLAEKNIDSAIHTMEQLTETGRGMCRT